MECSISVSEGQPSLKVYFIAHSQRKLLVQCIAMTKSSLEGMIAIGRYNKEQTYANLHFQIVSLLDSVLLLK